MPKVSNVGPRWCSPGGEVEIWQGDAAPTLGLLPPKSVQCCVTSPPYWGLRAYATGDYKHQEIGCERTPEEFIAKMVDVFRAVRRVLRDDGVLWLNLGDTYGGGSGGQYDFSSSTLKMDGRAEESRLRTLNERAKELNRPQPLIVVSTRLAPGNLVGVPWRVALALQADGWVLRSDVPWVKRSAMPESVTNRPAKALEHVFMFVKGPGAFFDMEAVRPPPSGQTGGACFGKIKQGEDNCKDAGQGARRYDRPKSEDAPGRAFRDADLWFASVKEPWGVVGVGDEIVGLDVTSQAYSGSHFATFPARLIEPLIRAATSERGCCARCGAPWERVINKTGGPPPGDHRKREGTTETQYSVGAHPTGLLTGGALKAVYAEHGYSERTTVGWLPGCSCEAEVVPCTVLDPFLGSGTTALTALKLGRRSVGIELSAKYIDEHQRPRIAAWLANHRVEARPPVKAIKVGKAAQAAQVQGDEL